LPAVCLNLLIIANIQGGGEFSKSTACQNQI
jgi:hypothetical protein